MTLRGASSGKDGWNQSCGDSAGTRAARSAWSGRKRRKLCQPARPWKIPACSIRYSAWPVKHFAFRLKRSRRSRAAGEARKFSGCEVRRVRMIGGVGTECRKAQAETLLRPTIDSFPILGGKGGRREIQLHAREIRRPPFFKKRRRASGRCTRDPMKPRLVMITSTFSGSVISDERP